MHSRLMRIAAASGAVAAAVAAGGYALASTSGPASDGAPRPTFECIKIGNPKVHYVESARYGAVPRACRHGFVLVGIGARGLRGLTGEQGPQGIQGAQGPQGPAASDINGSLTTTATLGASQFPTQLQYIGGTILQKTTGHGATNLLQVTLPAGTYLINASVKFDRSVSAGSGPDTYGYAALWTGATASTAFTSFSQGAGTFTTGALSRLVTGTFPNLDVIDAVASGSSILVVPAGGEVLNLSAFAYNADTSGGPYAGCVGTACTSADLSAPGSVIVTGADISVVQVGS